MNLYALRINHFVYHDDVYRWQKGNDKSRICGVYSNLESATQAWKKLEHETIARRPLQQIGDFLELPNWRMNALDKFVFDALGQHIVDDTQCEQSVAQMSVEQVFEFVQQADLCSYHVAEIPEQQEFYVCWMNKDQCYLSDCNDAELDGQIRTVLHDQSADKLLDRYVHDFANAPYGETGDDEGTFILHGTLEQLSHNPTALRELIASHRDIRYEEKSQILLLDYDSKILKLVYPLLTVQPLQFRAVNLWQLWEIQQKITLPV